MPGRGPTKSRNLRITVPGWHRGSLTYDGELRHGAFVTVYLKDPSPESYSAVALWAFHDHSVQLSLQWGGSVDTIEHLAEVIEEGLVVPYPPSGVEVIHIGRAVFRFAEIESLAEPGDLLREVREVWRQLRGEKTTLDVCREAVRHYVDSPSEERLAVLCASYREIPRTLRTYLISMDAKDHYVRALCETPSEEERRELTDALRKEIDYEWRNL